MKKCLICEGVFFKNTDFDKHLVEKHNLSFNEYYVEYIVKGKQYCPICGKEKKFDTIVRRYRDTCGDKDCIRSLKASWVKDETRKKERQTKSENTKLKNHGNKTYNNRSKYKETCLERYDVENGFQSPEIKEKIEQTHLKNLGVTHPSKSEVIKEKQMLKKNIELMYDGYLTKQKLIKLFKDLSKHVHIKVETNVNIGSRYRADMVLNDKYMVEFDGYQHYTKAFVVNRDSLKDGAWELKNKGVNKTIRIPYFVQLNNEAFEFFFGELMQELNIKVQVIRSQPHGFIDKKAVLPADFCC